LIKRMDALLLWVPFRAFMPAPVPLLQRLLAAGDGEIASLIPGHESEAAQIAAIAAAQLIIVDQSFLNALNGLVPNEGYLPDKPVVRALAEELFAAVLRCSAVKVLGLTFNDLHWLNIPGNSNFVAADLRSFARHFQALIWGFEQWGETARGELPLRHEDWLAGAGPPVENWNTLTSIRARFDCPFALHPQEVRRVNRRRHWDVSVMGALYQSRMDARQSALDEHLHLAPFRRVSNLTGRLITVRQRFLKRAATWDLKMRRSTQDFVAAHSGVNFVCGSGVRYYVRKFPEMAAIGSCMAVWPPPGLRHYGFRDGEHLAVCGEPSDFGKTARWLLARPALRERMGAAAQQVVSRQHTVEVRAAQMLSWLRELVRGRDVHGVYHEGEFQLMPA
jgi:hypothetical protein